MCEDVQICKCADVRMCRCADVQMFEDIRMCRRLKYGCYMLQDNINPKSNVVCIT